jgi:hypothetical protein
MPIDLTQVDWLYVAVLALFAGVASAVANLFLFFHRGFAAVLAAALFATLFVFWTYYPHGLPLPTSLSGQKSPVAAAAPAPTVPATPQRPRNPVTDITSPPPPSTAR